MPEILLRQAFSNYAQFTGVRFDPTPLVNARTQMQELIEKYPEVARRENMQSFVDSIDKTLARKLFVTADFFKRTSKPAAEKVMLQTLVSQYPQSDEAQQARRRQLLHAGVDRAWARDVVVADVERERLTVDLARPRRVHPARRAPTQAAATRRVRGGRASPRRRAAPDR